MLSRAAPSSRTRARSASLVTPVLSVAWVVSAMVRAFLVRAERPTSGVGARAAARVVEDLGEHAVWCGVEGVLTDRFEGARHRVLILVLQALRLREHGPRGRVRGIPVEDAAGRGDGA